MVSSEADTSERDKPLPSLNVSLCLSCWLRRHTFCLLIITDHKISGTLPVMFIAPKIHDTDLYWLEGWNLPSYHSGAVCVVTHFSLPTMLRKKKSLVIVPWWGDGRRSDSTAFFQDFCLWRRFTFTPHISTQLTVLPSSYNGEIFSCCWSKCEGDIWMTLLCSSIQKWIIF